MDALIYIGIGVVVVIFSVYVLNTNRRKPNPKPNSGPIPSPDPATVEAALAAHKASVDAVLGKTTPDPVVVAELKPKAKRKSSKKV